MSAHTIALQMPDPLYLRLQRLAAFTQRPVESLVLQALEAQIPPLLEDMPAPIRGDLVALEALYHEANCHMLRKAYANALLKWRGHPLPTLAELGATP